MFDTVTCKSGLYIEYFKEFQFIISKIVPYLFPLEIDFDLANSADPDELSSYGAIHLRLHWLS